MARAKVSSAPVSTRDLKVVVGVIGNDAHCIPLRLLDFALTRAGFRVINLGVMVSQEELVDAVRETAAHAVVISSMYGHAFLECQGLADKFREAGLAHIPLYIGGNLSVEEEEPNVIQQRFQQLGFRRVYPGPTDFGSFVSRLKKDLTSARR